MTVVSKLERGRPPSLPATDAWPTFPELVIVLPVTTTDRAWPHHVPVGGPDVELPRRSFAMTEQPRTITRSRITGCAGTADEATMSIIDQWLRDFTNL